MAIRHPGVLAALGAAILFGAATPLAKSLLASVSPWLLAGLLYLESGFGLGIYLHLSLCSRKLPGDTSTIIGFITQHSTLIQGRWTNNDAIDRMASSHWGVAALQYEGAYVNILGHLTMA